MFEGSDNIGARPASTSSSAARAATSTPPPASTRPSTTSTCPANQYDLALWIESERMMHGKIEQIGVDTQRQVVKEERRRCATTTSPTAVCSRSCPSSSSRAPRIPGCPSAACSTSTRRRWTSSASSTRRTTCPTTRPSCCPATSIRTKRSSEIEAYFGPIPRGPNPVPARDQDRPADRAAHRRHRAQNTLKLPATKSIAWQASDQDVRPGFLRNEVVDSCCPTIFTLATGRQFGALLRNAGWQHREQALCKTPRCSRARQRRAEGDRRWARRLRWSKLLTNIRSPTVKKRSSRLYRRLVDSRSRRRCRPARSRFCLKPRAGWSACSHVGNQRHHKLNTDSTRSSTRTRRRSAQKGRRDRGRFCSRRRSTLQAGPKWPVSLLRVTALARAGGWRSTTSYLPQHHAS